MCSKTKKNLFLAVVFSSLTFQAQAEKSSYGEMFIVEEDQNLQSKWKTHLSYGSEISNSIEHIHEAQLHLSHNLTPYWNVGIRGSLYRGNPTRLSKDIYDALATEGYQHRAHIPKQSFMIMTGYRPLMGRLNFFQSGTIQLDVWLNLGYGHINYTHNDAYQMMTYEIQLESYFSQNWGLHLGLGQDIEKPLSSDRIAKTKLRLGCSLKF